MDTSVEPGARDLSTPASPAGAVDGHDGACPAPEPPAPTRVEGAPGEYAGSLESQGVGSLPNQDGTASRDGKPAPEPPSPSTPSLTDYRQYVLAGARVFEPQHAWIYPEWLVAVFCARCGVRWLGMPRRQPCRQKGSK